MDRLQEPQLNAGERASVVAIASAADMLCNFPLWIVAKRVSAGVGLPPLAELYKGSGSLYLAMGPMVMVQDRSTAFVLDCLTGSGSGLKGKLTQQYMLKTNKMEPSGETDDDHLNLSIIDNLP